VAVKKTGEAEDEPIPLLIVSGGVGATGEQLVYTALAQFPEGAAAVRVVSNVRRRDQVLASVGRAKKLGGIIVHTLVDARLRAALTSEARRCHVVAIDLMGGVLSELSARLQTKPAGRPGLYRERREDYFRRVEAIEFAVAHDDGRNTEDLEVADIVLVGPSRVGKTPISMYLSMLGWKVANVPFVSGIPLPDELSAIDRRKVVALTIQPVQLRTHRRARAERIGAGAGYADLGALKEEVIEARRLFDRMRLPLLDVTDKPIEEIANAVVHLVGIGLSEARDSA
jgi:regulator of PEP synthase PpsR (kinase-PPPase family)